MSNIDEIDPVGDGDVVAVVVDDLAVAFGTVECNTNIDVIAINTNTDIKSNRNSVNLIVQLSAATMTTTAHATIDRPAVAALAGFESTALLVPIVPPGAGVVGAGVCTTPGLVGFGATVMRENVVSGGTVILGSLTLGALQVFSN